MTIRKATEEDIPYVIETGMGLHAKARRENVPVHQQTTYAVMRLFALANDKLFLVSEHDEYIRGFLMAGIENYWWADPVRGRRFVTDWAFYSEIKGDGLLMLKAMQEWAWMQPRVIECNCATNIPKGRGVINKLFREAGFNRVGGYYTMAKPDG